MPPSSTFSPDVLPSISCSLVADCVNITGAVCHNAVSCICPSTIPVYVTDVSSCLKGSALNTTCQYDEQCLYMEPEYGRCSSNKMCGCVKDYEVKDHPNVGINCVKNSSGTSTVDPTMIGILVGLALMFVIICVVLRLFAKARFRETRSIFNTANPRLMNASLFKDRRRGSTISTASGHIGTPGHTGRKGSPSPESPKGHSPSKNKKDDSSVAIETVD